MTFVIADRVKDTTTTTGTGAVTLSGTAPSGFQSFGAAIGNGNSTYYTIAGGSEWEVGIGTYTSAGTSLSRDTVLASSNSGSLVVFSAGTKDVFVTYPAERAVIINSAGNVGIGTSSPGAVLNVVAATTSDAVRITQTGTGNALVVEDSANPDSTPFVVDTNGIVVVGSTSAIPAYGFNNQLEVLSTSNSYQLNAAFRNDAFAPIFTVAHSRNTAVGSHTVVQSGDDLGTVAFAGSDGTAFIRGAQIVAAVDGTPGTNDMPGRLVFSTTADGAASPTERMRITNAGNVGIGTATPASLLHLSANEPGLQWQSTGSAITYAVGVYGRWYVYDITNSAERLTISNTGNVGIGTASPSYLLDVNGTARITGALTLTTALTAANGGTGLTSPGTSGNVLTSNGTAWVSSSPAASGVTLATARQVASLRL